MPDGLVGLDANPCSRPTPYPVDGGCGQCRSDDDCGRGMQCKLLLGMSACVPGCADDARCNGLPGQQLRCCAGQCVDVGSFDADNCGGCGVTCGPSDHRSASCAAGACQPDGCLPGWADCNQLAGDGCEVGIEADPGNCLGCGLRCVLPNAFAGCARGCYVAGCGEGFEDCNAVVLDGCEVDVRVDAKNCGACGNDCKGKPCVKGKCG